MHQKRVVVLLHECRSGTNGPTKRDYLRRSDCRCDLARQAGDETAVLDQPFLGARRAFQIFQHRFGVEKVVAECPELIIMLASPLYRGRETRKPDLPVQDYLGHFAAPVATVDRLYK